MGKLSNGPGNLEAKLDTGQAGMRFFFSCLTKKHPKTLRAGKILPFLSIELGMVRLEIVRQDLRRITYFFQGP